MKTQISKSSKWKKLSPKVIAVDPVLSAYGRSQKILERRKDRLAYKIDSAMWIQQHLIELGDNIVFVKRIQLLFIFFQAAMAIVFNMYSLSTFLVRFIHKGSKELSVFMAFAFFGYHILCAAHEVLMTILAFSRTFEEILSTSRIANELSIYVMDDAIRLRLLQFSQLTKINLRKYTIFGLFDLNGSFIYTIISGTATYIIILLQYGQQNDLLLGTENSTLASMDGMENIQKTD